METKITLFFKMAFVALVGLISTTMYGQTQISDEAGLRAIANDLAGDYTLTNDITLTQEWTPLGDEENPFTGTLNGGGYSIYGLKFVDSSKDNVGLIGVASEATISNLNVIGAQVYGGKRVGGIVGRAYAATKVEKCYTSGVVSGDDHVGGVIGGTMANKEKDGTRSEVLESFSTMAVMSTAHQAGGIIGAAVDVDVVDCYFAGVASCVANRTGGIIALVDAGDVYIGNSVVMASYLKGEIVHRILGDNNDDGYFDLDNNFSWEGTKIYIKGEELDEGQSNASGNDGQHESAATLKSASFYTNNLGWSAPTWKIEDGKYPIFSSLSYPLDGDAVYIENLPNFPERPIPGNSFNLGEILSPLDRTVSYTSSDASIASIQGGVISFIKEGPVTITFTTQGDNEYKGATVTLAFEVKDINYNITTEEDLRNIRFNLEGEFKLMNDITLTKDWEPIEFFKGKLDGNGKIIYGLRIEDRNTNDIGMFTITNNATITKLGIEGAYILANTNVGAIVGRAEGGVISECYVADSYIAGRDHVGSIVGDITIYRIMDEDGEVSEEIFPTVRDCYSGAHVYSREFQAGGIVGIIRGGTITKCYFAGVAECESGRSAGIVSLVDSDDPGKVENNINLAAGIYCRNGDAYRIGDFGDRTTTIFSNNWSVYKSFTGENLESSQKRENYSKDDDKMGSNLSTNNSDDLAYSKTFYQETLGWDFTNVWKFVSDAEGKMYPILKWQRETDLTTTVYGMQENAYLLWGRAESLDLEKVICTYGQKLKFDFIEGGDLVEIDNTYWIEPREFPAITEPGTVVVEFTYADGLNGIFDKSKFEYKIEVAPYNYVFEIKTASDLLAVNERLYANYKLVNNIDLFGREFYGFGSVSEPFTGSFDGGGYFIGNPTVITEGGNQKGLFNVISGATIRNLRVINFKFSGSVDTGDSDSDDLGGLVGKAIAGDNLIEQVAISGNIVGRDHVGGLIGSAANVTIRDSYANVSIKTLRQGGGLIGVAVGDVNIENSYFAGDIDVTLDRAAGVIALVDKGGIDIKISGVASIGNVVNKNENDIIGPFIGSNPEDDGMPRANISLFINNLYNRDVEESRNCWELAEFIPGQLVDAEGKNAEAFNQQSTYEAIGWDFESVWMMPEEVGYPILRVNTIGIEDNTIDTEETYQIYSHDNTIIISGIKEIAEVTVYNVNGQIVSKSVVSDNAAISVTNGLYIIQVVENGKLVSAKVFVK